MRTAPSLTTALGQRVRAARRAHGLSQKELAERAGMSVRFLGQLEGGQANVSISRLAEVAAALELSLVTLFAGLGPTHDAADRLARRLPALAPARRQALLVELEGSATPPIALVGLRGAGKSTLGRALAEDLDVPFVVVDERVRQRAGLALADLFEIHGPEGYHRLCRDVLDELLDGSTRRVLEIGGSVVTDSACWELLSERARVIWLRAPAEAHLERVAAQGDTRPMEGFANALARLRQILAAREPLYARAPHTIDTEAEGLDGARAALRRIARAPDPQVGDPPAAP